jgi:hypothetical protein
MKDY